MNKKISGFLIFLFLPLASSLGSPAPSAFDRISDKLQVYFESGDYLSPIPLLLEEIKKGEAEKNRWVQVLSWYLGYVGNYAEAVDTFYSAWKLPSVIEPSAQSEKVFLDTVSVEPAVQALCDIAKLHQVVMINENHHHPQHRVFGRRILDCFRKAGFRHFALETIHEPTSDINKRGRVSYFKTGYYVREPQMAGLINDALSMGFKIIRYETTKSCDGCSMEDAIDQREEEQANNLVEEVFKKESKTKLFIWPGFGHAYKRQLGSSKKSRWMAARLWEKTGIEPYCIEQLSEQYEWNITQPAFVSLNKKIQGNTPIFVDIARTWERISLEYRPSLRKTEKEGSPAIDAIIVYPKRARQDSRAKWLYTPSQNKVRLLLSGLSGEGTIPAQVFRKGADLADSTPLDQVLFAKSEATLFIFRGTYRVRLWRGNQVIFNQGLHLSSITKIALPMEKEHASGSEPFQ